MCTVKAYNKDICKHTHTHKQEPEANGLTSTFIRNTHQSCPGIKQWLDMRHTFITFLLEFI